MIIAISYHPGDEALMKRWASHVAKLGPYLNHGIVIALAHNPSTEGITDVLEKSFGKCEVIRCYHEEVGWPLSCNQSFEYAARHIADNIKQPFLWMEADAVPLKSNWIDAIEAEYVNKGKPFMGDFVDIASKGRGIDHMSGVAVYHYDLSTYAPSVFNNRRIAWDIASANDVLGKMHKTKLIHHDWSDTGSWRKEVVTKDCPRPESVIYHPDKNGVLFDDGLDGGGTRAKREPLTGGAVTPSSFEQLPPSSFKQGTDESIELAIQSAASVLKFYHNDRKTKKIVIQSLIEKGFIKQKAKKKQSRTKVCSSLAVIDQV
jgi:hypothetical protein